MNIGVFDLIKEIANYKSHEAAIDKRLEWQQAAQDLVNNETDHLVTPPDVCPVCGAPVYQEYNAKYHLILAMCEVCDYVDEWDEPDDVNPASIRY